MELQAFIEFAERYKNWGRWGDEDEIGTLNFVTPEHIVEACRLVRTGRIFALAIPFDEKGPQRPRADSRRFNPIHTMLVTGFDAEGVTSDNPPVRHSTDDMIAMPLQAATQWDSLAHIVFQGKMYNGRPYSRVDGKGAHKNSITAMKSRAMGRGVLLDVARHRGVDWLTPGEAIEGEELEECAARPGVTVKEGDFLLVRTGNLAMCRDQPGWGEFAGGARPGLGLSSVPWLHEKRVAAVAADNVHAAEEALSLIDVEYEVLPAVTDVESAMAEGAPQLHENIPGNVASHIEVELGDIEKGFAEADLVLEREYRTNTVHQGYIEPHSATAWWTPQGKITIWASSQGHFPVRDLTASVLGISESDIKVVPMEIGGGFGGKTTIYL